MDLTIVVSADGVCVPILRQSGPILFYEVHKGAVVKVTLSNHQFYRAVLDVSIGTTNTAFDDFPLQHTGNLILGSGNDQVYTNSISVTVGTIVSAETKHFLLSCLFVSPEQITSTSDPLGLEITFFTKGFPNKEQTDMFARINSVVNSFGTHIMISAGD